MKTSCFILITFILANGLHAQFSTGAHVVNMIYCADSCTGIAAAHASGGISPYTYNWSNGVSNKDTISGLCTGVYYVTVTDSSGASISDSVTLTSPSPLAANFIKSNPTCAGLCNGSLSAAIFGGTTSYTFCIFNFVPTPYACFSRHFQSAVYRPDVICAGVYYLEVTDANACFFFDSVIINDPPSLVIDSIINQNTDTSLCIGTSKVYISGGTPPYYFSWADSNHCRGDSCKNLCPGTSLFSVMDHSGCVVDSSISYCSNHHVPILAQGRTTFCTGDSVILYTRLPSDHHYQWMLNGHVITGATDSSYSVSDSSGAYTLLVYDSSGCVSYSDTSFVHVDSVPHVTLDTIWTASAITYVYASPSSGVSYLWEAAYGQNASNITDTLTTSSDSISIVCMGSIQYFPVRDYMRVIVTMADGCVDSSTWIVNYNCSGGVNEISAISNITLSPNPTIGSLDISYQISNTLDIQIRILDIKGQEVILLPSKKTLPGIYSQVLNTGCLAAGMYFVRITSSEGCLSIKFVKE